MLRISIASKYQPPCAAINLNVCLLFSNIFIPRDEKRGKKSAHIRENLFFFYLHFYYHISLLFWCLLVMGECGFQEMSNLICIHLQYERIDKILRKCVCFFQFLKLSNYVPWKVKDASKANGFARKYSGSDTSLVSPQGFCFRDFA